MPPMASTPCAPETATVAVGRHPCESTGSLCATQGDPAGDDTGASSRLATSLFKRASKEQTLTPCNTDTS